MNTKFMLLTITLLTPLAALQAMPPGLETAGDSKVEAARVVDAEPLPAMRDADPPAENTRRVLGAVLEPVPRLVAVHLPHLLAPGQGLLVTHVEPESPWAAAGIVANDLLHSCDAVPLLGLRPLLDRWNNPDGKETLVLGVIRRGVLYGAELAPAVSTDKSPACEPAVAESTDTRPSTTARSVAIRCDDGQIVVASTDNRVFEVRVVTPDGVEHHFTGERDTILGEIAALPERVQTYIQRTLQGQDPGSPEDHDWHRSRTTRPRGRLQP